MKLLAERPRLRFRQRRDNESLGLFIYVFEEVDFLKKIKWLLPAAAAAGLLLVGCSPANRPVNGEKTLRGTRPSRSQGMRRCRLVRERQHA